MRRMLDVGWMFWLMTACCFLCTARLNADEKHAEATETKPPVIIAKDEHHNELKFNLADPKQKADFEKQLRAGHLEHMEVEKATPNPLAFRADLGIWAL